MRIDREKLLKVLEMMLPGLSPHEMIEQSSCFVFNKGNVHTFNDEIACTHPTELPDLKGAIAATPLISLLRKLKEEFLELGMERKELSIRGKNRKAGLIMEPKIQLPIDNIDIPKQWTKLPKDFTDAVSMVQSCACSDESKFCLSCVHLTKQYMEACDGFQVARFAIKIPINKDCLIKQSSLKHIIHYDLDKFGESKSWIHFRNSTGFTLSCRRFVEKYPNMDDILKVDGTPISLPKGLEEAAERADIFSSEDVQRNFVTVNIKPKQVKVTGKGMSGWFIETKRSDYKGKEIEFTISPNLLIKLAKQHHTCKITQDRLKVKLDKFEYVSVLGRNEK